MKYLFSLAFLLSLTSACQASVTTTEVVPQTQTTAAGAPAPDDHDTDRTDAKNSSCFPCCAKKQPVKK